MKYETVINLQESTLQKAAEQPINKYIEDVYGLIVCRISNLIQPDFNRAWDRFPRLDKQQITQSNTIKEFYTPHCSLRLIVKRMEYIIQLTVTDQCFRAGKGIGSTELLRIAFESTRYHGEGFTIERNLEIKIDKNVEAIYKEQVDSRIDRKNLAYFNEKMKIEG